MKYINLRIKSVFYFAIDEELVLRNPAKNIKFRETAAEEKIRVWTREEQKTFTDAVLASDDELKYLYIFALGTGLRLGELLALTWDDVKGGNVRVNKNLSYIKMPDGKYQNVIGLRKSKKSTRTVRMPETLKKYLKLIPRTGETVFPIIDSKKPARRLHVWCKKLDITDITFHRLRATYATRLFEAGVQLKVVQGLLGHSTLAMTEKIYVQVMPDLFVNAADKLNSLF